MRAMICIDKGITEHRLEQRIKPSFSDLKEHHGNLLVASDIRVFVEPRQLREPMNKEPSLDLKQSQLNSDFSTLFRKLNKFSDVVLIVGEEKFPAHKNVLAARSPVFAAMFKCEEMKENHENEVVIEQMEPIVVEAMLEFIYTDAVKNLDELVSGLYVAADRYELRRLRALCERAISLSVEVDNAAEYLVLTDFHHAFTLKQCLIAFINNHLEEVEQSVGYQQMVKDYPALVEELNCSLENQNKKNCSGIPENSNSL